MLKLITIALTFALFLSGSCTDVVKPPPPPPPPPVPDTTSHDFMFETFVLGDGSSSTLYDVAIINDTLAYAVGEIYLKDSTGEFINPPYNIARWNGMEWQLLTFMSDARILYPGSIGDSLLFVYGSSIFARGPNDIWIAAGNIHHFNGVGWTQMQAEYAGFSNKIWGDDAGQLWCVGSNGTLIYYNGSTWQQIESGTTSNVRDIWGYSQQGGKVLAVVSSTGVEAKVLSIMDQSVIASEPWPVSLASIWVSSTDTTYLSGSGGVWTRKDSLWLPIEELPDSIFYGPIRGNTDYDIFLKAVNLMHYNGKSWHEYTEIPSEVYIQSLAVKQDMVVGVGFVVEGFSVGKAAIVVGKR